MAPQRFGPRGWTRKVSCAERPPAISAPYFVVGYRPGGGEGDRVGAHRCGQGETVVGTGARAVARTGAVGHPFDAGDIGVVLRASC